MKPTTPVEIAPPNPTPTETLGSFLRAARVEQGLELTAIAQATKITVANLRALEGDNRLGLPTDVFSRGFVKLYATHLKLDPLEALRLYDRQWQAQGYDVHRGLTPAKSSRALAWLVMITIILLGIFFGVREYYPGDLDDVGRMPPPERQLTGENEVAPPPADGLNTTEGPTATISRP